MTSRVAFFLEANSDVGSGHLIRCTAIAERLADLGVSTRLLTWATEPSHVHAFGVSVPQVELPLTFEERPADTLLQTVEPNEWLVIDHYGASSEFFITLSESRKIGVIADFPQQHGLPVDWLLDPGIEPPQLTDGQSRTSTRLLGPRYAPLRKQFGQARHQSSDQVRPRAKHVLVTLGSAPDPSALTQIVASLNHIRQHLSIRIRTPGDAPFGNDARASHHDVELVSDAADIERDMLWADIALSGGGSTLWELACVGVPTVVFQQSADQDRNVNGMARVNGAIRTQDLHEHLVTQMERLLSDRELRQEMCNVGRRLVDGQGAERCAHSLASLNAKKVET